MLDVPELVERHAVVPRDEAAHPGPELGVGADARLVDDELHAHRLRLGPRDLGEGLVGLGELVHELDGRREHAHVGQRALEDRRAELVARERAPQAATEGRAQEAVRRLDGGRLGDGDRDGDVRREHEVEREVALSRADVDDEVLGRQRAERGEPARLAARAERQRRGHASCAAGRSHSPGTLVGTSALAQRRDASFAHVGLDARRAQAEVRVQVRAAGVGVDEHDGLAELREVDRQVDRDEALADAAAPAADRDEAARALFFALAAVRTPCARRGLGRRRTGYQGRG